LEALGAVSAEAMDIYGHGGMGIVGLILVIVLIMILLDRI
jgi:hypothetical protein